MSAAMSTDAVRSRIAAATVRFHPQGGQGVIVPGPLIVTAAHVLTEWTSGGDMVLEPRYEEVMAGGRRVIAEVYAVEPVSDIAVLGTPDNQRRTEDAEAFEKALNAIRPVPICTADFPLFTEFPVYIFTLAGSWVTAGASQNHVNAASLYIASKGIVGRDSGSPVVTDRGRLIGVISTANEQPMAVCSVPRLHLTAPGWLVRRMRDPQWEIRTARAAREGAARRGLT